MDPVLSKRALSFSIVIETANVHSGDRTRLGRCLDSIAAQAPLLDDALQVVLLVERRPDRRAAEELVGCYPFLRIHEARLATYVAMKEQAGEVTTGDIVVLADSDCSYPRGWLRALLEPFSDPRVVAVTGETAIRVRGAYSLAVAATFNFPGFSDEQVPVPSDRYWANTVALKREALESLGTLDARGLGRGSCVLHAQALRAVGAMIVRQPNAHSLHAVVPGREFVARYFALGRDYTILRRSSADRRSTPAFPPDRDEDGAVTKVCRRLSRLIAERPARVALIPVALPIVAGATVLHTAGRLVGGRVADRNARV